MIRIYKGDATDFADIGSISVSVVSNQDITGFTGKFCFMGVEKSFPSDLIEQRTFSFNYTSEETDNFCLGENFGTFYLFDKKGRKAAIVKVLVEVLPPCRYEVGVNGFLVSLDNAFDYNKMGGKPRINGVTVQGDYDGRHYGLQKIPVYDEAATYAPAEQVIYDSALWLCVAQTEAGAFDQTHWVRIGASVQVMESAEVFPQTGTENVLYVDAESGLQYVWHDSAYLALTVDLSVYLLAASAAPAWVSGDMVHTLVSYQSKIYQHPAVWVAGEDPNVAPPENPHWSEITLWSLIDSKVDKIAGKGLSSNDYTDADKEKLDGIEPGANKYILPPATDQTLGGIKVGQNLSVDADGTLNADAQPQEQADWDEDDPSSPAYIKNKPGEATAQESGLMSSQDKVNLDRVVEVVPQGASSSNPLVTAEEMEQAISEAGSSFLGVLDYHNDLGFPTPSSTSQINNTAVAAKLGEYEWQTEPTDNDLVYVAIRYSNHPPANEYRIFEFDGSAWAYRVTLNNISFTDSQWNALNSGITQEKVAHIDSLYSKGYIVSTSDGSKLSAEWASSAVIRKTPATIDANASVSFPDSRGFAFVPGDFLAKWLQNTFDAFAQSSFSTLAFYSVGLKLFMPSGTTLAQLRLSVRDKETGTVYANSEYVNVTVGAITDYTFSTFVPASYDSIDPSKEMLFVLEGRSSGGSVVDPVGVYLYSTSQFSGVPWKVLSSDGTEGAARSSDFISISLDAFWVCSVSMPLAKTTDIGIPRFSPYVSYAVGDPVIYGNVYYKCTVAHSGAWDAAHFTKWFEVDANKNLLGGPVTVAGTGCNNVALGTTSTVAASGCNNVVIGKGAYARKTVSSVYPDTTSNNVVIGSSAHLDNSGDPDGHSAMSAVVIGSGAHGGETETVAIGSGAIAAHYGAVVIGCGAYSHGQGTINLGSSSTDLAKVFIGDTSLSGAVKSLSPVQSVNGSTGAVSLTAGDVGALSTEDGGVVRGNVAFGGGLVIGSTAVPSDLQGGEVRVTFIRSDYSGCVLVAPNGKVVVGSVGANSVSACSYEGLPTASSNSSGIVKIGSNINVDMNGVISIPFADNTTAGVIKMDGSSDAPLYLNASSQITARVAGSSNLGIVKGGGNVEIDSIGTMSVPNASTAAAGVVLLADTPINCSCSYANSSDAHIEAVTPYGFSLGLRYMIPYRGSSGGYDTHDRQIRHLNRSEVELAEQASIPLPQQGDPNAARDFIVDVDYRTDDSSATAHTLRLGSNYGTAWHVCVAEGEDLTDMLTFNPGEVARLYFTETALHVGSSGDRAPVFLVARQNVEMAEVNNG